MATAALLEEFASKLEATGAAEWPTAILAVANPDGCARQSRYNAHGVDLNRNCDHFWSPESEEPSGPAPWSEPEICALRNFIWQWRPRAIVSLHWALAELDADGPQSRALAEKMWGAMSDVQRGPYRVRVSETGASAAAGDYMACPGSLGQWCGFALRYPDGSPPAMVTLELPYDPHATARPEVLPGDHLAMLRALWAADPGAYLSAVGPGVERMLRAACAFA